MLQALKDVVTCPHCHGHDIVYSCEPKCCFNHVCADCRSTFELNTEKTGRFDPASAPQAQEPPSGDPTTGCPACDSIRVGVLSVTPEETLLVCGNCNAVLRLKVEEFVAGGL